MVRLAEGPGSVGPIAGSASRREATSRVSAVKFPKATATCVWYVKFRTGGRKLRCTTVSAGELGFFVRVLNKEYNKNKEKKDKQKEEKEVEEEDEDEDERKKEEGGEEEEQEKKKSPQSSPGPIFTHPQQQ
ncbi:uncharacterized protein KY384_005070 [Bacidia gigantensis]|uniref:uncharacterized protein n=1 Tax=Bacidia gigantensis TaxID=2732470 RepID=UPI001D050F94|nr:uncharacterized protein KY384_005070 [Bacidia gigantensis]KAG8530567.1 hypothetical protein KY384_005070 [Bacidia gigantensis]